MSDSISVSVFNIGYMNMGRVLKPQDEEKFQKAQKSRAFTRELEKDLRVNFKFGNHVTTKGNRKSILGFLI